MIQRDESGLDPRVWLAWGGAASLVPLLGRNPFPLLALLIVVLTVRSVWTGAATRVSSWRAIVRLAVIFSAISVVFNVVTVRSGNRVLTHIPEAVPLLHGPVTLNALVFGLLSALAVVILVLIGTTVGALVDWTSMLRLLPERMMTFAVAGSVAIAFVPRTAVAFREIREAQSIRGHRFRGLRDVVPIVVPLLTGGLERAVTMAEALEARGFGASVGVIESRQRSGTALLAVGLTLLTVATYFIAVGDGFPASFLFVAGVVAVGTGWRQTTPVGSRRTRYRTSVFTRTDWVVLGGALFAAVVVIAMVISDPRSLRYEPYPELFLPRVNLLLIAAQLSLLVPAFAPLPQRGGR